MKKFRRLVLGGIESKIVSLILVAMLLVMGLFLAVTLAQSSMLSDLAAETSERQLSSVTGTTAAVIDTVIKSNMDQLLDMEAQRTDRMFRELAVRVQLVGDYAAKLLSDPDAYPRLPWNGPDPSKSGQLSVNALLAYGVKESDVDDKLGLLANMTDLMTSVCSAYGTDNVWFSVPEGATLMADTLAGNWVRTDGSLVAYDAPSRYWYQQAVAAGKLVFSDVEFDKRTGELCVTCALPVYGADGTLLGVAGSDLFLTEMQQTVAESAENGGYLVVVNQDGHVILAPPNQDIFRVLTSSLASDLRQSDNAGLASLVSDALQGKTDVRSVSLQDSGYYMIGVPMKTVGWALVAAYSEDLAGEPVRSLENNYRQIQDEASAVYLSKSGRRSTTTLIVMIILLILMLAGALVAGKRIVKPLNGITSQLANLSEDNMEFQMQDSYKTGDEVELLARSFADLSHKTMEYIDQVRTVTAEKERIGTELHVAQQIQEGMLPSIFPAYPDRTEFDLYATMNPAKEVGGDFYDYFLIDQDHLALVMADVSGKGVPAALFMMVSKAILKNNAMLGKSAGDILTAANETICSNNKMQMFVTAWIGILEISTGRIIAANAGHEYPALCRNGGSFELFRDKHGFVVGGMEGIRYKEYELVLQPGDKLFLYTDGVPEATNGSEELFGTARMIDALNRGGSSPESILKGVRDAVDAFVDSAEQFDDLTMLCLEYRGPGQSSVSVS